jgi:hypothetical protein
VKKDVYLYSGALFIILLIFGCRKPFEPPAIKAGNHFLVVDGFINTGSQAVTTFTLSRSLNLDSNAYIPETGAEVAIQSSSGSSYSLIDSFNSGIYYSQSLTLDPAQTYRLSVKTSDDKQYLSDFVEARVSPPIDSIEWELKSDPVLNTGVINIFVNSHDPANNTHYYRWNYLETSEYHAALETAWGLNGNRIYPLTPLESTYTCWTTAPSTNILLGSSIALSKDVISRAPIASFIQNDERFDVRYSMLLKQYPLTAEAYNYWLVIQKNSQQLGGLFDLQPSEINGNIHCVTNPAEPVLGYISASTVQEKRIFIDNHDLPGWKSNPVNNCPMTVIPTDPSDLLLYNYSDTSFGPYYFTGGFPPGLLITKKACLDCRYKGGTNIKPSFWQ